MAAPRYSSADFVSALQSLLPRGRIWPRDSDTVQAQVLGGYAPAFERQADRSNQLIDDAFPGTTNELLAEWEATLGLPSKCTGQLPTVQARRNAVVGAFAGTGGQSIAYYVGVAAALGYTISITEFREQTVNDDVNSAVRDISWRFVWQVNAPAQTVTYLTVNDDVNTPLAASGNQLLECVLTSLKPAHTQVHFAYS